MSPNTATALRTPSWTAPMPAFFDPKNADRWDYRPDLGHVFGEAYAWKKSKALRPAIKDGKKIHLLIIDAQRDFCFPQGTLYVGGRSGRGAMDDSTRIASFIYNNLNAITEITATLDTHVAFQIFSPSFWEKADGSMVDPHTVITVEDLDSGTYRVSPQAASVLGDYMWITKQVRHYCSELERAGKYKLYIWPFHCILGSDGHALVGVVEEAAMFHAFARGAKFIPETKGGNAFTENYSVLRPEVLTRFDGQGALAQKNTKFIKTLLDADRVIIGGQASSHCVKSTIDDLLSEIVAKDPALARKVYVLEDCMSAVAVPNPNGGFYADFTQEAQDALARFAAAGMHVVKSTDSMDSWTDF